MPLDSIDKSIYATANLDLCYTSIVHSYTTIPRLIVIATLIRMCGEVKKKKKKSQTNIHLCEIILLKVGIAYRFTRSGPKANPTDLNAI